MDDAIDNEEKKEASDYNSARAAFDGSLSKPTMIAATFTSTNVELNTKRFKLDENSSDDKRYIFSILADYINYRKANYHKSNQDTFYHLMGRLSDYFVWLLKLDDSDTLRFTLIKDYETYRVNEVNVLPQSSGCRFILASIKEALKIPSLQISREARVYLDALTSLTKLSKDGKNNSDTSLTGFLAEPWARSYLGQDMFLRLESPKILMKSFSVSIAKLLIMLLDVRISLANKYSSHSIRVGLEKASELANLKIQETHHDHTINKAKLSKRSQSSYYAIGILELWASFDDDGTPDLLTELILNDVIVLGALPEVRKKLQTKKPLTTTYRVNNRSQFVSRMPQQLSPKYIREINRYEEILFGWLCAWQCVQATDVAKLHHNNFMIEKNISGTPIFVQCTYYKSRAIYEGKEPPLLSAKTIQGQAIIKYLNLHKELMPTNTSLCPSSNRTLGLGARTLGTNILNLFKIPPILRAVEKELNEAKASPIFIKATKVILDETSEYAQDWSNRKVRSNQTCSMEAYREETERPANADIFSLSMIKNTSVYADSDQYRIGDLTDKRSHSSETEGLHYMTDKNQEWKNQNGRITRHVMNDIKHVVYKPNISVVAQKAAEFLTRTKIITGTADGKVTALNTRPISTGDAEFDEIIVVDSPETVLHFLHFKFEATIHAQKLATKAPKFFERTVLPTLEWMETLLLDGLSKDNFNKGTMLFESFKEHLPALFTAQLSGSI